MKICHPRENRRGGFFIWYTISMEKPIYIKKADGTLEPFNETKLVESLEHVGTEPSTIAKITEKVKKEIHDGMTTGQIYHLAFSHLRESKKNVATKYSLRRALSELGPNGFPFEKFIAAILRTQGYEAVTDQIVYGGCVPHEMDVIAWKDDELIMIEAKFHNEFGFKSDVKVALYIKARFDDLKENMYEYGGKKRKITDGWLITNTKFTDQAIHYAECKGLKLIGWNYPAQNNLQDMIEKSGLHPFTALTTLSATQKKHLLAQGVILCEDIVHRQVLLKELGMSTEEIANVLKEIDTL